MLEPSLGTIPAFVRHNWGEIWKMQVGIASDWTQTVCFPSGVPKLTAFGERGLAEVLFKSSYAICKSLFCNSSTYIFNIFSSIAWTQEEIQHSVLKSLKITFINKILTKLTNALPLKNFFFSLWSFHQIDVLNSKKAKVWVSLRSKKKKFYRFQNIKKSP